MANIGSLSVQLSLDAALFASGLDKSTQQGRAFASTITKVFSGIGAGVALGESAFGAAGGAFQWVKSGIDDVAELGRESKKLGLSTEQLSGLQFAMHGTSEGVATSLTHLNTKLFEAAQGSKDARDEFAKFNLDGKKLAALGTNGALEAIADKMRDVRDATYNSAIAVGLMGKGGKELIPILEQGASHIRDLEASAGKLGAIVTAKDVALAQDAQRAMDDLSKTMTAIQRNVAVGIAPYVTEIAKGFGEWVKTLDLKKAIGDGFEWLNTSLIGFTAGFGEAAKGAEHFINKIDILAQKAAVLANVAAHPETVLGLQNSLRFIDAKGALNDSASDKMIDDSVASVIAKLAAIRGAGAGVISGINPGAGVGGDFGTAQMVKNAELMAAPGLNIFQKYNAEVRNLDAVFGPAAKHSQIYNNAIADLNETLKKNSFAEFGKAVDDAAGPLDKLMAKYEELNRIGLKSNPAAYASALSKEFLSLSPFQAAQHAPGALLAGSDAAHSAAVAFQRDGQQGSIQDQIKAGIDRMVESQKQTEMLNKRIADLLDDRLAGRNPFK